MPRLHALYRTLDDAESTYRALVELGIAVDDVDLLRYEAVASPSPAAPGLVDQMTNDGLAPADAERYAEGLGRGEVLVRVAVAAGNATGAAAILSKYHPILYDRVPTPQL